MVAPTVSNGSFLSIFHPHLKKPCHVNELSLGTYLNRSLVRKLDSVMRMGVQTIDNQRVHHVYMASFILSRWT